MIIEEAIAPVCNLFQSPCFISRPPQAIEPARALVSDEIFAAAFRWLRRAWLVYVQFDYFISALFTRRLISARQLTPPRKSFGAIKTFSRASSA